MATEAELQIVQILVELLHDRTERLGWNLGDLSAPEALDHLRVASKRVQVVLVQRLFGF